MKNIIIFLVLVTIGTGAFAQNKRGIYGTNTQFTALPATMTNRSGTANPSGSDTLRGVDTAYAYWHMGNTYFTNFDLSITPYSYDSTTGAAILQGSNDNVHWQSITGSSTLCTTCIGASATITNAKGNNHYIWEVSQIPFSYWRSRLVGSRSTDTTVVTASAYISY